MFQVGGHFGLLQCGGHVAKPMNAREMAFYEMMTDNIRQFTPEYCGGSAGKDRGQFCI